ncbi:MAG TPA: PilN domain-containing protein, partial [Vicinamibacteria bacterium]|nr:PilN domain-containing protein [Vicinamibacteria bacterium]
RLRSEANGFVVDRPDAGTVARWTQLKDLVDRRLFSWSGLFSVLEDTLPTGVRLELLAPGVQKGKRSLRITAVARTVDDALEFMRALEDRPEFEQVWPNSRGSGEGGFEYQYEMQYLPPERKGGAAPAPSPVPSSSAEPTPAGAVASARALAVTR